MAMEKAAEEETTRGRGNGGELHLHCGVLDISIAECLGSIRVRIGPAGPKQDLDSN
jgi:hypothetical protein